MLGSLPDPKLKEWKIFESLIQNKNHPLQPQAWKTLRSSVKWFEFLDTSGIIEQWLQHEDEEFVEHVFLILLMVQGERPERLVQLLKPFLGKSETWFTRLKVFVFRSQLAESRDLFDLFLLLIEEGIFDQQEGSRNESEDFWLQIYPLKEKQPDWACEAIACYLNRWLNPG